VLNESNGATRRLTGGALSTILVVALAVGVAAVWTLLLTRPASVTPVSAPSSLRPSSAPSVLASPTPPPDPTAGWIAYSDSTDRYSLRYPAKWIQRTCVVDGHSNLYLAPAQAALGVCTSGYGGQMNVIPFMGDQRYSYELGTGYADIVTQTVTVNGVSGVRQAATVAPQYDVGPPAGTKVVQYLFFAHNRTYLIYYGQTPNGAASTNVLTEFDLMVTSTFAFSA
jgi:hypothetical protein